MHGWRARIGLILPMDNAVMEPEYYSLGLPGISFHAVRINTIERQDMPTQGAALSEQFVELGANAVVYACAETSFLQGANGNVWIEREIERKTNLPAITATSAIIQAVAALGLTRVALVAPYPQVSTDAMMQFLKHNGVNVVQKISRDFNDTAKDPREWYNTNLQRPEVAYQMARSVANSSADAIVIAATNFRTIEIIEMLEADLKIPVITTNQAVLWAVLRRLRLQDTPAGLGRLFASV